MPVLKATLALVLGGTQTLAQNQAQHGQPCSRRARAPSMHASLVLRRRSTPHPSQSLIPSLPGQAHALGNACAKEDKATTHGLPFLCRVSGFQELWTDPLTPQNHGP